MKRIILFVFLELIEYVATASLSINSTYGPSAKYCIDDNVVNIFKVRYEHCMAGGSAARELEYLRAHAATDYQRAHELIAHMYFLDPKNPNRVFDCSKADFEYIPLVPLSWRTGIPSTTLCTANGYCPKTLENPDPKCSYKNIISDIVKYVEYVTVTKKIEMNADIPKFSVASTFNLRTCLSFGLPNSNRNGKIYEAVTSYVINSYIGHYERHPQCPDVLRKWWKHVVEIPYNPIQSIITEENVVIPTQAVGIDRSILFFFSGRLLLWGPERICSVRCAVFLLFLSLFFFPLFVFLTLSFSFTCSHALSLSVFLICS